MKKSKIKINAKKVTRRKQNPSVTFDDIDRIGGNLARTLANNSRAEGVFLRRGPSIFEYMKFDNSSITKIQFNVTQGTRGLRFTVKINSSPLRYWDVSENTGEVYWFLKDLFTGELK